MVKIKFWISIRVSYIVFLFVKTENSNFKKEIKHVLCSSVKQKKWKREIENISNPIKTKYKYVGYRFKILIKLVQNKQDLHWYFY